MFINVDPPHELFMDKSQMKAGENVRQAAGKFSYLLELGFR